ncbi:MAG: pantoate--beta-alanine ligase, partial [Myxococcales bacterium]|nr:pantoate--beta-alanine ligase [Myxococcales bacterium]
FVNPTQFGPGEDLDSYPRTLEADAAACAEGGVAALFAPRAEAMYPPGDQTRVTVQGVAHDLCGAHRPGHFEGVATVVSKLFNVVGPCVAVFGRKDYQQLQVLKRLARDLFFPIEVVGVATVREPDGLALSSRNVYLSPEDRARALAIPRGLSAAANAYAEGERRADALVGTARAIIEAAVDRIDYVTLADADDVTPLADDESIAAPPRSGRAVLAVAARVGKTRLIDNLVLGEDPPPLR